MDHLSVWISNRQLLDQIDIEPQQHFIINEVFNGFENILQILMQHQHTLSLKQHLKLQQLLTPKCDSLDIWGNYQSNQTNDNNNKLCIGDVPNDCLSHIFTFLDNKNKVSIQKSCRLFAILTRPITYSLSHSAFANKPALIKSLTSNDNEQQLQAVETMGACKCFINDICHSAYCRHYVDIKNYSKELPDTLTQIISNNIIYKQNNDLVYIRPLCLNILLSELAYNCTPRFLSICVKIFNSVSNGTKGFEQDDDEKVNFQLFGNDGNESDIINPCKIDAECLLKIIRVMESFSPSQHMAESQGFLSSLFNLLKHHDLVINRKRSLSSSSFDRMRYERQPMIKSALTIIDRILQSHYDITKNIVLNHWNDIPHGRLSVENEENISEVLRRITKTATEEQIDVILSNDQISKYMMMDGKYCWNIRNIVQNGNATQRKCVIDMVLKKRSFMYKNEFIPDLLKTLSDRCDERFNLELEKLIYEHDVQPEWVEGMADETYAYMVNLLEEKEHSRSHTEIIHSKKYDYPPETNQVSDYSTD